MSPKPIIAAAVLAAGLSACANPVVLEPTTASGTDAGTGTSFHADALRADASNISLREFDMRGEWVQAWPGQRGKTAIIASAVVEARCQPSFTLFMNGAPTVGASYDLSADGGQGRVVYEEQCHGESAFRSWHSTGGTLIVDDVQGGAVSFHLTGVAMAASEGGARGQFELAARARNVSFPRL